MLRILLACPNMTRTSLWQEWLSQEPDIVIVGEASGPVETLLKTGKYQAEVVVIDLGQSGGDPGLHTHLLEEYPDVEVIAVSADGDQAIVYRKGIIRNQVLDISSGSLKQVFRSLMADKD